MSSIEKKGSLIVASGVLDAPTAERLVKEMKPGSIYMLDFSAVEDVRFAALRMLLNARKGGAKFTVVCAPDAVAEKFEDTGVSAFVSVSRKPKQLDMSRYVEFGESFMSKAYNSTDGDSMIKVYGSRGSLAQVAREKAVAKSVMLFGIPTPLVGTIYHDGEHWALDFERITPKRSFSRIISEEPERLEEITVKFAGMCRQLHETPCDTVIFSDRRQIYRSTIEPSEAIPDGIRSKALAFIDRIPEATTCLHGDMQPSNVITTGKEEMWIDLADFCYGYPMMDLSMWYFLSNVAPEGLMMHLFHLGKEEMKKIWDIFCREYFGTSDTAILQQKEAEIRDYCILHMIFLGCQSGFEPFMMPIIEAGTARW